MCFFPVGAFILLLLELVSLPSSVWPSSYSGSREEFILGRFPVGWDGEIRSPMQRPGRVTLDSMCSREEFMGFERKMSKDTDGEQSDSSLGDFLWYADQRIGEEY